MILEVNDLNKDFRKGFLRKKVSVLKDISFGVNEGEIYGIVGPNGAGKTTTFKCILGFISLTAGKINLYGKDISDHKVKTNIGYLPENPYFYEYLTGYELLSYMGHLHGMSGKTLKNRIYELLEKVNLSKSFNMQLRKYSKGMLQRIGIAQAIMNDPEFVIFDEPMSGLDPVGRREVRDIILELKSKGKTVMLSSHILSDLEALCDKVCFIFHGEVVKEGSLYDLEYDIQSGYEAIVKKSNIADKFVNNVDMIIEKRGDLLSLKFTEKHKKEVLRIIYENNINLISLHPLRKSLESIFNLESAKESRQ